MQHPAQRPGGVSSSTESKNVQCVIRLECPHEELICIRDVVGNAVPKCQSDHFGPPLTETGQCIPGTHRSHSGVVVGDLRIVVHKHFVKLHDVGLAFSELVARSVTTD